jgi:hypothetical protein
MRPLARWLAAAIAVVAALGLAAELLRGRLDEAIVAKLSLSYEGNLPTWFTSSLLLAGAIAAGSIARGRPPDARGWWGVSAVLGWASLDEAVEIHEHLGGLVGTRGVFTYDWVWFGAAIVVVLAAVFLPFLRALPTLTRRRLIVAGAIYLTGALVMELPLGWWVDRVGHTDGMVYAALDWIEETLEMIGAALVVLALVAHREAAA